LCSQVTGSVEQKPGMPPGEVGIKEVANASGLTSFET
jgi:hypothetical protein